MNQDQVLSVVRAALLIAGTFLIQSGVVSAEDWGALTQAALTIAGGACIIGPIAWSIYVHSKAQKLASVAAMPEVNKIVTDSATADAIPSDKVVSLASTLVTAPKPPSPMRSGMGL